MLQIQCTELGCKQSLIDFELDNEVISKVKWVINFDIWDVRAIFHEHKSRREGVASNWYQVEWPISYRKPQRVHFRRDCSNWRAWHWVKWTVLKKLSKNKWGGQYAGFAQGDGRYSWQSGEIWESRSHRSWHNSREYRTVDDLQRGWSLKQYGNTTTFLTSAWRICIRDGKIDVCSTFWGLQCPISGCVYVEYVEHWGFKERCLLRQRGCRPSFWFTSHNLRHWGSHSAGHNIIGVGLVNVRFNRWVWWMGE